MIVTLWSEKTRILAYLRNVLTLITPHLAKYVKDRNIEKKFNPIKGLLFLLSGKHTQKKFIVTTIIVRSHFIFGTYFRMWHNRYNNIFKMLLIKELFQILIKYQYHS